MDEKYRSDNKVQLNVRVNKDVAVCLRALAAFTDQSVQSMVEESITRYITSPETSERLTALSETIGTVALNRDP